MKAALLGLPQAGKRTLFSLLTRHNIPESRKENESIEGSAIVHDVCVDSIAKIVNPQKIKYADIVFVLCPDIMGENESSNWLETARRCDLLCMLVRSFKSDTVYHVKGSVSADRDRKSLELEILLADLGLVEKRLEKIAKEKRSGQTQARVLEEKTLFKCIKALEEEKMLTDILLEEYELDSINSLGLLTLKPVVWTYNIDDDFNIDKKNNHHLEIACKVENEIMAIDNIEERKEYMETMGFTSSGLDRMNNAVYDQLGLMSFYTMGEDEVRAWTIRKGTKAPTAAGKIHSDIERGFIRVEIIKYNDLIAAGSESIIKKQGKSQLKGKNYIIEEGDICNFRFNV